MADHPVIDGRVHRRVVHGVVEVAVLVVVVPPRREREAGRVLHRCSSDAGRSCADSTLPANPTTHLTNPRVGGNVSTDSSAADGMRGSTVARVTIVDVAKRAGVSLASTSRALNGLVASAETVEKVRAAAAELGYTADANARSLKLGRTQQLAYAVADIGNPVYVEMMGAIERVVAASDYRLVISSTGDADATVELVRSLGRGFVDGMVLSPLRVTDELVAAIAAAPVPVVVLGRMPDTRGRRHGHGRLGPRNGARRRSPRRRRASPAGVRQRPRRHDPRALPPRRLPAGGRGVARGLQHRDRRRRLHHRRGLPRRDRAARAPRRSRSTPWSRRTT